MSEKSKIIERTELEKSDLESAQYVYNIINYLMSSPDCTVYLYLAISVSHKTSMTCNVVNLQ